MLEILKAAFKTGSGSAISMTLSVISAKIMALITGTFGVGLYSMIQQILQTSSTFGSMGGGGQAVIQGIAHRQEKSRDSFLITAYWIFLAAALVTAVSLVALAPWIAALTLGDANEANVGIVRWIALPLMLSVGTIYINSVLNGYREIGRLALVQVSGAAANSILSYPVSILVNSGYPIAFVAMLSVSLTAQMTVALLRVRKQGYFRPLLNRRPSPRVDRDCARSFFSFAGTILVTGLVSSISILAIRALIVQDGGFSDAGIFNVAWVICMMYPMIALSSFSTYYFPTLSKTKDEQQRIDLMRDIFKLTTLVITPMLVVIIALKPLVVDLLYSNEFLPSLDILRWMLIGVYIKATSWVFGMPLVAIPNMRAYFFTEISWNMIFVVISILSIEMFGSMEMIGVGFLVAYVFLLFYYYGYSRTRHGFTLKRRMTASWSVGLVLVVASSAVTWTYTSVDWLVTVVLIAAAAMFMWFSLTGNERRKLLGSIKKKKTQ